ncbi:sideroflexin-2 isoform X4 [Rhinopithecus roxellana]|uniref:sideroflexin-2 isoform X4 n=1 Tax=Rhinopithecus roxellana TaxID=61622 RepID=UPI0012373B77|nr:sideroflexin-2 isoform X4 [Rhinopithecus roxellana]
MTIHWAPPKPSQTMPSSWSTVLCVNKMEADLTGFNIDAPRWDQRTFLGRVKHFLNITDPRTVFVSEQELDWAKVMVEKSRMGVVPPGTQVEQLLYAKKLYDSAFHPDTGEKMNVIGRMSFQLPGGMIITGFMLQFYRTMPAVIFWQWVNQSFNALVNYTNRNAASPISVRQMTLSYFTATTTAVATAVGMNMLTKKAPPLVGRWVPFAAVAAANCVNIPMMRQQELIQGICVKDRNENEIGHSRSCCQSSWKGLRNCTSCRKSRSCTPHCRSCCVGTSSSSWCQWRVGSSHRNVNYPFPIWNQSSKTPSRPSMENLSLMSTSIRVSKCPTSARTSLFPYSPAPS